MSGGFTVVRRGALVVCADESGSVGFEPGAGLPLDGGDVVDIEGGVDLADFDAWLDQAARAANEFLSRRG